jgi:hypothetical protein
LAFRLTEYAKVNIRYQVVASIGKMDLAPGLTTFLTSLSTVAANRLFQGPNRCCVGHVASETMGNIVDNIVEKVNA